MIDIIENILISTPSHNRILQFYLSSIVSISWEAINGGDIYKWGDINSQGSICNIPKCNSRCKVSEARIIHFSKVISKYMQTYIKVHLISKSKSWEDIPNPCFLTICQSVCNRSNLIEILIVEWHLKYNFSIDKEMPWSWAFQRIIWLEHAYDIYLRLAACKDEATYNLWNGVLCGEIWTSDL